MTKIFISDYRAVALLQLQEPLFYRTYGDYQGEWLLISEDAESFYFYKGSYGSCGGCDDFEATFDGSAEVDPESDIAKDFLKNYKPYLVIPKETAGRLANDFEQILALFPRNMRGTFEFRDYEEAIKQFAIIAKYSNGLPLEPQEILDIDNLEVRRQRFEEYGEGKFLKDLKDYTVIDQDHDAILFSTHSTVDGSELRFILVQDSSTPRKYLLRVDPRTKTAKEGKAASFGLREEDYILKDEG